MDERVSAWAISDAMGKPRQSVREEWLEWGLLRPPGPDGRWDANEIARITHAKALALEARRLSRRALLMHRDGFVVAVSARRRAMADVLTRISRPKHKAAQVLWELRALDRVYRGPKHGEPLLLNLEVSVPRFPTVLETATDALVDHWYQSVALQAAVMPGVGQVKQIPICDALPYEERLSLLMCHQLLHENHVRNRLGLVPVEPRYGPPTDGQERSNGAPVLRGQLPPPRTRDR